VNESTTNTQGFPGREFTARNSGGGVLNSRLIYAARRSTCSPRSSPQLVRGATRM
jgi:hypothetical protein